MPGERGDRLRQHLRSNSQGVVVTDLYSEAIVRELEEGMLLQHKQRHEKIMKNLHANHLESWCKFALVRW